MTLSKIDLLAEAEALQPRTLDLQRRIHQLPELGNDLPETKKLVMEAMAGLDLEIRESQQTSGIVATLRGGAPGPTRGLCRIDANPRKRVALDRPERRGQGIGRRDLSTDARLSRGRPSPMAGPETTGDA